MQNVQMLRWMYCKTNKFNRNKQISEMVQVAFISDTIKENRLNGLFMYNEDH